MMPAAAEPLRRRDYDEPGASRPSGFALPVASLHGKTPFSLTTQIQQIEAGSKVRAESRGIAKVYHIHHGDLGLCHSGRHDGKPAIPIGETGPFPTQECARRAHGRCAFSFNFIG
jgi:hypothetical protein